MFNPNEGWGIVFVLLGLTCGIIGWGVIEFIIWLFSFVHVSFGG